MSFTLPRPPEKYDAQDQAQVRIQLERVNRQLFESANALADSVTTLRVAVTPLNVTDAYIDVRATVTDPASRSRAELTLTLTFAGLDHVDQWTGSAWVGAASGDSYVLVTGGTHDFRLYRGMYGTGNGRADLTATAPSRVAGSDSIDVASIEGRAVQGTVSIGSNGAPSWTQDGPPNQGSILYLESTSASPSVASVLASGVAINGNPCSRTGGAALTFGQTLYVTGVSFTGASGAGTQLASFHIQGSYQSYTATKTLNLAARVMTDVTDPTTWGSTFDANYNLLSGHLVSGGTTAVQIFAAHVDLPTGVTATRVEFDTYNPSGISGVTGDTVLFNRLESQVSTNLGTASVAATGWQTVVLTVSETLTAARAYLVGWIIQGTFAAGWVMMSNIRVVYTVPDPSASR